MSEHNDEIEAIKRNRDAILAEKRALQSKLEALQAEHAELTTGFEAERKMLIERAEAAETRVADYEINYPVDNFLSEVAIDAKTFKHVFGENYKFAVVEGDIAVVDLAGSPVMVKDDRGKEKLVRLNRSDFENLLYPAANRNAFQERMGRLLSSGKAMGGGAIGASGAGSGGQQPATKPDNAAKPAMRFGLGQRHGR